MAREDNQSTETLVKGIWENNPVFVQVLGCCPTLAVTNSVINSITMSVATAFVLICSSFLVAAGRKWIPTQVRMSVFIVIIATFVTLTDYTLLALTPKVHKALGAFIPLIVVNCIILGRAEAFAYKNTVKLAVMDAIGMSIGFTVALLMLGSVREILGSGSFFGIDLFGPGFEPWVIMILPPGGFLTFGLLIFFFNWFTAKRGQFLEKVAAAERSSV